LFCSFREEGQSDKSASDLVSSDDDVEPESDDSEHGSDEDDDDKDSEGLISGLTEVSADDKATSSAFHTGRSFRDHSALNVNFFISDSF